MNKTMDPKEIDNLIAGDGGIDPPPDGYETLNGKSQVMPESLRRHLIKVQHGKMYLPAAYRLAWFRSVCPDWGIFTDITEGGQEAGFATVKATIFNPEGRIIASAHKTETRQDFPAGWVEKAESGSISRAIINAGFGAQFDGGDDEPAQGEYQRGTGAARSNSTRQSTQNGGGLLKGTKWTGLALHVPPQDDRCPDCHAPRDKAHGKPCVQ